MENRNNSIESALYHEFILTIGDEKEGTYTDFIVENFNGNEAISEMYEYSCTIKEQFWENDKKETPLSLLIGAPVKILATIAEEQSRLFSGVITKCAFQDPGVYSLTIHPKLWFLTLNNKYYCYGNKNQLTLKEVIEEVLNAYSIPHQFDIADNNLLKRKQNWLQAGETDFEFFTRMIEKASMYYYFEHLENESVLIISNKDSYKRCRKIEKPLRYVWTNLKDVGLEQNDLVKVYSFELTIIPSKLKSTIIRSEASWEKEPPIKLTSYTNRKELDAGRKENGFHHCKVLQFGVDNTIAEIDIKEKSSQLKSSASRLSGESTNQDLELGHLFSLSNSSYADKFTGTIPVREELNNKDFVVVSIEHSYSIDTGYTNRFSASEPEGSLVPFSIQNTLQGSLLATVCSSPTIKSPNSDEDYRYLRKDIDFNWDTTKSTGSPADNINMIGVYVRFATDDSSAEPVWIKLSQQMKTVPEIGAIVLIARANDDSEIPEIQNIIDSNGSTAVTKLDQWAAQTQVGNNYSVNYGDSKSIRYGKKSPIDLENNKQMVEDKYASGNYKEVAYNKGATYNYSTADTGNTGLLSESETHGNTINKCYGSFQESHTEVTTVTSTSDIGSQNNSNTIGTSVDDTSIGAQASSTRIGAQASNTAIGAQASSTEVGASENLSIMGISNSQSIALDNTSINIFGINRTINLSGAGLNVDLAVATVELRHSMLHINLMEALEISM
jgi:type VI secretion system secreted protein VgrG